jgi:hypothetical protein
MYWSINPFSEVKSYDLNIPYRMRLVSDLDSLVFKTKTQQQGLWL